MFEPLTMMTRDRRPEADVVADGAGAASSGWPELVGFVHRPRVDELRERILGALGREVASAASASISPTARSHSATAAP